MQANSFTIRRATAQDVPAIFMLVKELAEFEKEPEAVTVSLADFADAGFGPNPVWEALVACDDQLVVRGFVLWYKRFSTWTGRRLYLEDFYVQPSHRGMGMGKSLFLQLVELAKNEGYTGMMWQVLDWNTDAIQFYKKMQARMSQEWINCHLDF